MAGACLAQYGVMPASPAIRAALRGGKANPMGRTLESGAGPNSPNATSAHRMSGKPPDYARLPRLGPGPRGTRNNYCPGVRAPGA